MPKFINPKDLQIKFISVYKILSAVSDDTLQSLHRYQENSCNSSKITSSRGSLTASKILSGSAAAYLSSDATVSREEAKMQSD
jgi:hypothetical protein